jgi:hypothetical protein
MAQHHPQKDGSEEVDLTAQEVIVAAVRMLVEGIGEVELDQSSTKLIEGPRQSLLGREKRDGVEGLVIECGSDSWCLV